MSGKRIGLIAGLLLLATWGLAIERQPEGTLPAVEGGNNALYFDGVDDYLEIPEIAAIRTERDQALTVEFWAFIPPYGDTWHKVLSKWGAGGGEDDEFVVCLYQDKTFGMANTGKSAVSSRTEVPTNTWCHLCCVWDGANGYYRLYLNGEFIPQKINGCSPLQLCGEPIRIGTDGHRGNCFKGLIDEVRIWNVARTQGEIQSTMKSKLAGDEGGLVGYWDFDEGAGQVVHDLSASGNRGKLGRLPLPDKSDPRWVASGIELGKPL
jgi:hypothetical protein